MRWGIEGEGVVFVNVFSAEIGGNVMFVYY